MAFRDPKLKKNFWGSMPTQRLIYPNYMYYNMNAYNDYGLIQLANFTNDPHIMQNNCSFLLSFVLAKTSNKLPTAF